MAEQVMQVAADAFALGQRGETAHFRLRQAKFGIATRTAHIQIVAEAGRQADAEHEEHLHQWHMERVAPGPRQHRGDGNAYQPRPGTPGVCKQDHANDNVPERYGIHGPEDKAKHRDHGRMEREARQRRHEYGGVAHEINGNRGKRRTEPCPVESLDRQGRLDERDQPEHLQTRLPAQEHGRMQCAKQRIPSGSGHAHPDASLSGPAGGSVAGDAEATTCDRSRSVGVSGISIRMTVPFGRLDSKASTPPSARTRSRMPQMPLPSLPARPWPLSRTIITQWRASIETCTSATDAPA